MAYDEQLHQDIKRDFRNDSSPVPETTQYMTKDAIQSMVIANQQIKSEISRFNGDINKAYDFYNGLYNSEKSKLNAYSNKIADYNYKIIQDKKLLSVSHNPLELKKINERI